AEDGIRDKLVTGVQTCALPISPAGVAARLAIMEAWQKAGVPLEAALKGIDRAFESYGRSRQGAGKPLKSLAYCTDAVLDAAEEQLEAAAGKAPAAKSAQQKEPFSRDELKKYFA